MIDQRAIVHSSAKIANEVKIAPYAIIGPGVEIGSGTTIGEHVLISSNTKIGINNEIHPFAALGGDPQHTGYKGEATYLEIGDDNIIREFCTLNRGTLEGGGVTRIGSRNFLMSYVHIAHDCVIGNEVTLANNASVAGHVRVGDYVFFSPFSGIHQFVTIGSHCFLGRATKIGQDIPPYMLVTGSPGAPRGLNLVGLKRRGFDDKTLRTLRKAYHVIYRESLSLADAILELKKMAVDCPEIQAMIDALENSKRGIARKLSSKDHPI